MKLPTVPPWQETELRDPANGSTLRIVEYQGHVYFELVQNHAGVRTANLMRVDRDIAVPTIRRIFT